MMILDMMLNPDARDRQRLKHFLGLFDPQLTNLKPKIPGDRWHGLKNFVAEWSRLDPQRSGKVCFDLLVINVLLLLLLLWVTA